MKKRLIDRFCDLKKGFAKPHIKWLTKRGQYIETNWKLVGKILFINYSSLKLKRKY